jgi:hypothetical protein
MSAHSAENDGPEWTGCVHCGKALPHDGTGWREAYRCRLFQRIHDQAWNGALDALLTRADEGNEFGPDNYLRLVRMVRQTCVIPPEVGRT